MINSFLIGLFGVEKLEEIELDGFLSLKELYLQINSLENFKARNLKSLKKLHLFIEQPINKSISMRVFQHLSSIEELNIKGVFSDLNLDSLVNLKSLKINGSIDKDFNNDLFKNICENLQELSISLNGLNEEKFIKLFFGLHFPNLHTLKIGCNQMTKIEKKFFDGFSMLQNLSIYYIKEIDFDAFSNLTQLVDLVFYNNNLESLDQRTFSKLLNLENLYLSDSRIVSLEENMFSNLKNLANLNLSNNELSMLNPNWFIGLENLKFLNLSKNKLRYFDLRIFDNILKVEKIDLYHNLIKNKEEIFKRFEGSNVIINF